jgi:hypothetical protein
VDADIIAQVLATVRSTRCRLPVMLLFFVTVPTLCGQTPKETLV